jgi:hypothetical protein
MLGCILTDFIFITPRLVTMYHVLKSQFCFQIKVSESFTSITAVMARATTRSQKVPKGSQSQPRPSQSQRPRRSRGDESDEEGDEPDEGQAGAGMDMDEEDNREQGDARAVSTSTYQCS